MVTDTQQSTGKSGQQFSAQRLGWALLVIFTAINIGYSVYLRNQFAEFNKENMSVRVAMSVGSQDPYWDDLIKGAEQAALVHDVELEINRPADINDQSNFLRKAHVGGDTDGIAFSPVDVDKQADLINIMTSSMDVVTIDSDAPATRRDFYIGTNNYDAGHQLGGLVKEVLPDGGKIVITVGSLAKVNGQQRRQGLIDALIGREYDRNRVMDPVDEVYSGNGYTVMTYTDGTSMEKARENAAKALSDHPDTKCIVGLYGYSIPETLAGLKEAGVGEGVKLLGFDTAQATLDGIRDGRVYATLEQRTEQFGYDSIAALARMARSDNAPVLESRLHACRIIKLQDLTETTESEGAKAAAAAPQ